MPSGVSPRASSPDALARMRRQRRRGTAPELALRQQLHRSGMRYRLHLRPIPGLRREVDIAFTRARVAVFVDSCFWHGCPEHATWPSANADWWREKLEANRRRDRDTDARFAAAGWDVVRIWEHEDPSAAAARISARVDSRRGGDHPHEQS